MKKSYVMIHVIKHDMDPNMDLNYSRKIGPISSAILITLKEFVENTAKLICISYKIYRYKPRIVS